MDLPMWWLVYLGFILGMVLPMAGVAYCARCYKGRRITPGKTSVVLSVILSLALSAVGVYELTVLLESTGNNIYLVWFGFWGPFIVMDLVYLRMMLFTKWAKRMMGQCKEKPATEPKKVMTIDDIGKDWETRIAKMKGEEEE
jgi:hypothetical protein